MKVLFALFLFAQISIASHAAPLCKSAPAWSALLTASMSFPPGGCQLFSTVNGTNFDSAESYPLTLKSSGGQSDTIVIPKTATGKICVDETGRFETLSFSVGGKDLKIIVTRNANDGSEATYMAIGQITCGIMP